MRLITRRIYRAFPELDRYGDEQCERFVKAARGSWLRCLARGLVVLVVALVVLAAGVAIFGLVASRVAPNFDLFNTTPIGFLIGAVGIIGMVSLSPVVAFVARDLLLRRRVRFVLRSRGVCSGCWYSLIGLPVAAGNVIHCPECNAATVVDPSLGELVTDGAGQARFQPEVGHVDLGSRFWTPRRKRVAKRVALWGTVGVVVLAGVGLGLNELFIHQQARAAKVAIIGIGKFTAHIEAYQRPDAGGEGAVNIFEPLARAAAIRKAADEREWLNSKESTPAGNPVLPEFIYVFDGPDNRNRMRDDPDYARITEELARRMLEVYAADGLEAVLAEVAAARRAVREYDHPVGEPLVGVLMPELGEIRALARICAARMKVAREKNDREGFTSAFEQGLALGRAARHQPLMIDGLVGIAVDELMLKQLSRALMEPIPDAWLEGVAGAIDRQLSELPLTYHFEGERLMGIDTIAWTFSQPERVRWGRFSSHLQILGASMSPGSGRLGTFAENTAAYTKIIEDAKSMAASDPATRPPSALGTAGSGLVLVDLLQPAFGKAIWASDQSTLKRRGVLCWLAIERFRAKHGRLPEGLEELTPTLLKKVPLDPYTGKPFVYRVLPIPDEHGRRFLLYSTGVDQRDDGGISGEQSRKQSGTLEVGPSDIVINEIEPPPAGK